MAPAKYVRLNITGAYTALHIYDPDVDDNGGGKVYHSVDYWDYDDG